ncbi:MAG TPA: tol-pal system protein YbgF [Alphaproteobacteria bacterium]
MATVSVVRPFARYALALSVAIGAGLPSVISAPALAQQGPDVRSLVDQIERLRRDVDVLQRQLARSGGASIARASDAASVGAGGDVPSSFIAQTDMRFATVDDQLRDLTGKVEELNYKLSQMATRLDKLVGDVDFRLTAIERGGAGAAPPPGSPSTAAEASTTATASAAPVGPGPQMRLVPLGPSGQPVSDESARQAPTPSRAPAPAQTAAVTLPDGSPEAQYEFAYAQLLQAQREQGDFGRAESALRAFIAAHPNHRLAGNAQYWLGETYYVRRDFAAAAAAFAEGFKRYPNSEKAPDNLLKLGMSLGHLNRKGDACGTLGELERRYPNASVSIKQAIQREKQRLNCS